MDKQKYTVICRDETGEQVKVGIMAFHKVDAKEKVLENHRSYTVTGVLTDNEIFAVEDSPK